MATTIGIWCVFVVVCIILFSLVAFNARASSEREIIRNSVAIVYERLNKFESTDKKVQRLLGQVEEIN